MQWPQEELGAFMALRRYPEIEKAISLARDLHKKQLRKGTNVPYFEHLAAVACMVQMEGGTPSQVIAAFLHDAIEDQGHKITLEDINEQFGSEVAEIVKDCTHEKTDEEYRVHKGRAIQKVHDSQFNPLSHLVITCDKLHNAESIIKDYILVGEELWDRFNGTKDDIVWYHTEMYKALRNSSFRRNNPTLDVFERAIRVMNSF